MKIDLVAEDLGKYIFFQSCYQKNLIWTDYEQAEIYVYTGK